ncbi:MAG: biotin-independent malonate decarboxylase subunit gamma, partial [Mycobacterium leprae]
VVVGRAISGGFLCHGLQADRILALGPEYGTMVHVMPLTSIARVTKVPLKQLEELAEANPVFAAGVPFFYRLGGVDQLVGQPSEMRPAVLSQVTEIRRLKAEGAWEQLGPVGRGRSGWERGGRLTRQKVLERLEQEGNGLLDEFGRTT